MPLDCKKRQFTLTVVEDVLTAVGGLEAVSGNWKVSHTCLSLTGREGTCRSTWKWEEILPCMELIHMRPAVACSENILIVVGGKTSAIEILDTHTMQWSRAGNWYTFLDRGSAHIHEETVYLSGVVDLAGPRDGWVILRALSDLLQERKADYRYSGGSLHTPVYCYTGALVQGQFLAIGGSPFPYSPKQVENSIFRYNPITQRSEEISKMKHARSYSLVAVLPSNKIVVVGGFTGEENTSLVEIGTVAF